MSGFPISTPQSAPLLSSFVYTATVDDLKVNRRYFRGEAGIERSRLCDFCVCMSSPAEIGKAETYKVVLLGESCCGKSSLVLRLVEDEFRALQPTVGAAFLVYRTTVDDITVNLEIWDTAGQERYLSLAPMYYRGAAAALVVYDITSLDSFNRAKYSIRELMDNNPETMITLVGNNCD